MIAAELSPLLQSGRVVEQTAYRTAVILVERLSLTHFRNYRQQEVELPRGLTVLYGDNAQGKSNFLEACYLLATTRPLHGTADRELAGWDAFTEPLPYARVRGHVRGRDGETDLEIVFQATETFPPALGPTDVEQTDSGETPSDPLAAVPLQKTYRINGVRRRAVDMVGRLKMVFFGPEDVDLVAGPPVLRRRYLDLAASQVDQRYLRTLQQFNRVVTQRNFLLRRIREREAVPSQLQFWNDHLVGAGAYLLAYRHRMLHALGETAQRLHTWLAGAGTPLALSYQGTVDVKSVETQEVSRAYHKALEMRQEREIAAGQTLVGPHRDDLRFLLGGVDMGVYGSRGQRRTLVLAIKLAEADYMRQQAGDTPVLLLDDVLSELDPRRRTQLLEAVSQHDQALVTSTALDTFPPSTLGEARLLHVVGGRLESGRET